MCYYYTLNFSFSIIRYLLSTYYMPGTVLNPLKTLALFTDEKIEGLSSFSNDTSSR